MNTGEIHNKINFNCSIQLYEGTCKEPFALLCKGKDIEQKLDLQCFRPDPRNYMKTGKIYPAHFLKEDGIIRRIISWIGRDNIVFTNVR